MRLGGHASSLAVADAVHGAGGADPEGEGLRGLVDRVEALAGTLEVDSPTGRGTRVRARFPLDGRYRATA